MLRVFQFLFAMGLIVLGAGESEPIQRWTTHALQKVRPLDPAPEAPAGVADLFAGRNEFEPFQIVLRTKTKDLTGVDIEFSDLRTAEGAEISRSNVTVYYESFLNLDRPSSMEGGNGLWPDPLIPKVDRYAHEARNAFPFTLRRGLNQPLWVEIFVPPTARPGKYTGAARIIVDGAPRLAVPIHLTVWGFVLPSTSTLRSSFGLNGINLLKQHRGRYTDDKDLHSITGLYAKAALLHRISIHGGSMQFPKISRGVGKMRLDWQEYDAEAGPLLDGETIREGEPLQGARVTSSELRRPKTFEDEEQEQFYYAEWARHFRQKGWSDRLFLYLWDEPADRDFPELLQRGKVAQSADPKPRTLVTTPFTPGLQGVVQIWCPLVNCLIPKPGFADFCALTPPLDSYQGERRKGKSLWFYQSCASHGCNIVGAQYFTGWPSYVIDAPAVANRVTQWLAWKYQIEGELYYSMNEAYGQGNDPWRNIRLFGGNGDGTLFFPGRPDRIGGRTDIPVESIRLKLIREGMEDYEYLALLAKFDGRRAANEFADRIVKQPFQWESRPGMFLGIRRELGAALDRAVARSGAAN